MDELDDVQKNKAEKLLKLAEDPALAISEQIDEINLNLESLIKKETPPFPEFPKAPDVQRIVIDNLSDLKGDKGDTYTLTDDDKLEIAQLVVIPTVEIEKIVEKVEVIREQPIVTEVTNVTNEIREVAMKDTPDETVDKVNASNKTIQKDRIEGMFDLERIIKNNQVSSVPVTTSFVNGQRAKNFNFNGATVSVRGDTAFITTSGGGHTIEDEGTPLTQRTNLNFVGAGVAVTDDAGNDATVVTISTSAGAGFQATNAGSVNGSNTVFGFAVAPNAIVVDGISLRKVATDGTVNWTGTTTITLSVAPNFDLYGVA